MHNSNRCMCLQVHAQQVQARAHPMGGQQQPRQYAPARHDESTSSCPPNVSSTRNTGSTSGKDVLLAKHALNTGLFTASRRACRPFNARENRCPRAPCIHCQLPEAVATAQHRGAATTPSTRVPSQPPPPLRPLLLSLPLPPSLPPPPPLSPPKPHRCHPTPPHPHSTHLWNGKSPFL